MKLRSLVSLFVAISALGVSACAGPTGEDTETVGLKAEGSLPVRAGAVLVDGCVIDTWQRATLASPRTRRVVQEVILLCLVPRLDGTVGPRDPSAKQHLADTARDLKNDGYRVHFGLAFTDETGQRYDGAQTRAFLANGAFRQQIAATLPEAAAAADGVEIDLQFLPDDTRSFVTDLMVHVSNAIRPAKRLGIFVPPSVTTPSDLPGGEAFARAALVPLVDRMRVMTLDFSETSAGPTIDPGWAVDAARLALTEAPGIVDIAYPLYGTDFGPRGRRSVTYFEGIAIASLAGVPVLRGPTTAPFVRYAGLNGEPHELWFDDADSTARALGAWSFDVLPANVGVLFYGLGAEDPSLFEKIGSRYP